MRNSEAFEKEGFRRPPRFEHRPPGRMRSGGDRSIIMVSLSASHPVPATGTPPSVARPMRGRSSVEAEP
jgi:hypothetical protein